MGVLSSALKYFKTAEYDDFNVYKWLTKKIYEQNRDDLKDLKSKISNLPSSEVAKEVSRVMGEIDGRDWVINLIETMSDSKEDN